VFDEEKLNTEVSKVKYAIIKNGICYFSFVVRFINGGVSITGTNQIITGLPVALYYDTSDSSVACSVYVSTSDTVNPVPYANATGGHIGVKFNNNSPAYNRNYIISGCYPISE